MSDSINMEALSAATFPTTPQTRISHVRSSHLWNDDPTTTTRQPTRSLQPAESQEAALSAPASQESYASAPSVGSSFAPQLQTGYSDVSQFTSYTDFSPPSSAPGQIQENYVTSQPDIGRVRTPEEGNQNVLASDNLSLTSPMSITSPMSTNGAKRTASGHIKNAPSLPTTVFTATSTGRHSRTNSLSSTGSRAGDLAMTLRTRLGYAMAKVQHGWEHKTINEVEHLAAHKMSPNRHSMSHLDYSGRPVSSGLSNGTARLFMYDPYNEDVSDGVPPMKRHSAAFNHMSSSQPILGTTPRLQPAPDIRSAPGQRYYHTAPSSQTNNYMKMSPPRTPVNGAPHRPPTIRTEMQTAEAERDALQALFQLGSPHTSQIPQFHQNASQASSSQASPLRSEFATPRRVTFARSDSDSSAQQVSEDGALSGGEEREIEVS